MMPLHVAGAILLWLRALTTAFPTPAWESNWTRIEVYAQQASELEIPHPLSQVPLLVRVYVKSKERGTTLVFPALGGSLRDNDFNSKFGGILYLYNASHVVVMATGFVHTANETGARPVCMTTPLYNEPTWCTDKSAEVKVRIWASSQFPQPDVSKQVTMNTTFLRRTIHHNLSVTPDLVIARLKIRSQGSDYYSDGIGPSEDTHNNATNQVQVGGLMYFYNSVKIEFLLHHTRVFCSADNFGYKIGRKACIAKDSTAEAIVFKTISSVPGKTHYDNKINLTSARTNKKMSINVAPPLDWNNYLVITKVVIPNTGNVYDTLGSALTDQTTAYYKYYGGVIVGSAYPNLKEFRVWYPVKPQAGFLVKINAHWGNDCCWTAKNEGILHVRAYPFDTPATTSATTTTTATTHAPSSSTTTTIGPTNATTTPSYDFRKHTYELLAIPSSIGAVALLCTLLCGTVALVRKCKKCTKRSKVYADESPEDSPKKEDIEMEASRPKFRQYLP